jgi:hypothetical protein
LPDVSIFSTALWLAKLLRLAEPRSGSKIIRMLMAWPCAQVPAAQADRVAAQLCPPSTPCRENLRYTDITRTFDFPMRLAIVPPMGVNEHTRFAAGRNPTKVNTVNQ